MGITGWGLWLVIAPILTFLHELAHAVVGLRVVPDRVWIKLGSGARRRSFRLGRIDVHMHTPLWFFAGHMGYSETVPNPRRAIAVSLAGPVSSLTMGLSLAAVHLAFEPPGVLGEIVWVGMQWALIQGLMTGIPMTYPAGMPGYAGQPSDGLRALRRFADIRAGRAEPSI